MTRWFSFALLLIVIIGVAAVFVRVMSSFLLPLFLATMLVVMFRPLHNWMLGKLKGRNRLAALLTTISIAVMVLVPFGGIAVMAGVEASSLIARLNDNEIRQRLTRLRTKLGLEYEYGEEIRYLESSIEAMRTEAESGASAQGDCAAIERLVEAVKQLQTRLIADHDSGDDVQKLHEALLKLHQFCDEPRRIGTLDYQSQLRTAAIELHAFKIKLANGELRAWLKEVANPTPQELQAITEPIFAGAPGFLRSLGGATSGLIGRAGLGICILLLAVYFFLADGSKMVSTLMRLSPLDDRHELELLDEFDRISRAVVIATLLSAVVQGALAGVGFWLAGVGSIFLLSTLTIIFALVPFVGAATVWLPVSLSLYFSEGRPVAAIVLAVYGACIVSMADNVIKPMVLHGQSNLHPLLALLSVLGGVRVLGPIGILVGPMVVVFLQTLLNILHRELIVMDQKGKNPAVDMSG